MNGSLEAITAVKKEFDKLGPVVTEIWFVDRPADYVDFVSKPSAIPTDSMYWYGVRVFNVNSVDMWVLPPERRLAMRVFQMMPGIWMVMNDGTVRGFDG
jgi:hypothetical protein